MASNVSNFASSTLHVGISDSDTELILQPGDGLLFPSPNFQCVIYSKARTAAHEDANKEIITVTDVSDDTFTIVRAQEGTTKNSWSAGDKIYHTLTAGDINSGKIGGLPGVSGNSNKIVGVNNAANSWEYKTINGTNNQVNVANAANSITLSTPQDLHTDASPEFNDITLSGGKAELQDDTEGTGREITYIERAIYKTLSAITDWQTILTVPMNDYAGAAIEAFVRPGGGGSESVFRVFYRKWVIKKIYDGGLVITAVDSGDADEGTPTTDIQGIASGSGVTSNFIVQIKRTDVYAFSASSVFRIMGKSLGTITY